MTTVFYAIDKNKAIPIHISEKSAKASTVFAMPDGSMWEEGSIAEFYHGMPTDIPITIIDVGAHVGLYCLYAKLLPKSTFYAFEPHKLTYDLLTENVTLNNLTNVQCQNIGISSASGTSVLNTSVGSLGLHTMGATPLRFSDIQPVNIEVETLDNLFYEKDIAPVYGIKIDTEGWEYHILKGAEKLIRKYKPRIQIERVETNMQHCGVSRKDLNDLISAFGYHVYSDNGSEVLIQYQE